MQEIFVAARHDSFLNIHDPTTSVHLLPDTIINNVTYSAIVAHKNHLLHEKYSANIVEYQNELKNINSTINMKLSTVCMSYKIKLSVKCSAIENHLYNLEKCESPSTFHDVWGSIMSTVSYQLESINLLRLSCISIEQERIEKMKLLMQENYISVKNTCNCDNEQLAAFYSKEIISVNTSSLNNHKNYTNMLSALKMEVVESLYAWHNSWELLLFSWRDKLTRQNIKQINSLANHESFLCPCEISDAHKLSKSVLNEIELSINESFSHLPGIMPITIESAIQTFDKIDQNISHCKRVIENYQDHTTQIYDLKFASIIKHIDEMRDYLTSNFVLEENKSVDAFEDSIFVICSEFEKNVSERQVSLMNELEQNIVRKKIFFKNVKDYVFSVCTTWCEYINEFDITCKKFIDEINCYHKDYNNRIIWLEKSLDKTCDFLLESQTFKSLDKKLASAKADLQNILNEHNKYEKDLHSHLNSSMSKWNDVEGRFEIIILKVLGLQEIENSNANSSEFLFENRLYKFQDCSKDDLDKSTSLTEFKISCCKNILKKFVLQKDKNKIDISIKLKKIIKQAEEEVKLRIEFHSPRMSLITKNCYEARKCEIEKFKFDCDQFWDEATCCEMKYTELFTKLESSLENIIETHISIMSDMESEILKREPSNDLTELRDSLSLVHSKSINDFHSAIEIFKSEIIDYKNYVERKHLSLLKHAELEKLKFTLDQKIKNEFDEFNELAIEMKVKAEELEAKAEFIHVKSLQTLSLYKHTLFCLFYLERRDGILKTCRLNIKTHSVACCKEIFEFGKEVDAFLSKKYTLSSNTASSMINQFQNLYSTTKKLTVMFDYSAGNEKLRQCASMEKLHRKYSKFSKGNCRSLDSSFIKEIYKSSKEESSVTNTTVKPVNHDDFNWKIQRSKVIHHYVGCLKAKYGVGVKIEHLSPPKKILRQQRVVQSMSLIQPTVSKENTEHTEYDHKAIIAKTCAKLRDRVSKNNSKSISEDLPGISKEPEEYSTLTSASSERKYMDSKYFDMEDSFKLIKTAELFSKRQSDTSCKNLKKPETNVYDFNKTSDDTMKAMLFDSENFFQLKKRSFDANIVSSQITSLPEKVKFHLRLAIEDFIIMSEVFFRQKNIQVTKNQILKDSDLATKDMENVLQTYFDQIVRFSHEGIEKLKDIILKLNSYQLNFITLIFKTQTCTFDDEIKSRFSLSMESFNIFGCESKEEFKSLIFQLKPSLSHPNNQEELHLLQEKANNASQNCLMKLELFITEARDTLKAIHKSSLDTIESYKSSMYNIVDQTIHPEYIKKISRSRDTEVVHQACFQDNVPDRAPRKLHKTFSYPKDSLSEKQHVKFYDHIAIESAHAIIHIDNVFKHEMKGINMHYDRFFAFVQKWKCYWKSNVTNILNDIVY